MTVDEFIKLADSVTYKPDERVWATDCRPRLQAVQLELARNVPDAKHPASTTMIRHSKTISIAEIDYFDMDTARHVIYAHLRDAEIHECEEFLKFGGLQYRDPHAGE